MKKILFLLLICPLLYFAQVGSSQELYYNSSGRYVVPCGVTKIRVDVWAGGGGSGAITSRDTPGGAGGGGGFSSAVYTVSTGDSFGYVVGRGGNRNGNTSVNGQDSWFKDINNLKAFGGIGSARNSLTGAAGGSSFTTPNTDSSRSQFISHAGGNGGNGESTGWLSAVSGGGGAAGSITRNGANGANGDFLWQGGLGGLGGVGEANAGSGGNGRSSTGKGNEGKSPGGGAGGSKKISILESNQAGGEGGNGLIKITILEGDNNSLVNISGVSEVGYNVNCTTQKVQLSAIGGTVGNGVSTLWYKYPVSSNDNISNISIPFAEEMMDPVQVSNINMGEVTTGNRNFISTSGDPMIHLEHKFPNPPTNTTIEAYNEKHKYIIVRYRINNPNPPTGNLFEVFYKKEDQQLSETNKVEVPTSTDNGWNIVSIDMTNKGTNNWSNNKIITGIRFDMSTQPNVDIDIDYILLSSLPVINNRNDNDAFLEFLPEEDGMYKVVRIADQHRKCEKINVTITTEFAFPIDKVVKTFSADNGNWSVTSNWNTNGLPVINRHCVIIPNGKNAIVNIPTAEAKKVTVLNGGKLSVNSFNNLTVLDDLVNLGDGSNVVIENDGNLLQVNNVSNTGNITVKRNTSMKKNDYTYWGSPVEGQNLRAFSPGKLYTYNEWDDYFTLLNGTDNFDSKAKGYAIQAGPTHQSGISTAFNGVFLGKPKNGNIVMTLKRVGRGYNLIGNPYPSNIDFAELYKANSDLIYNTAYFWTNLNHNPESQGSNYPNGRTINNYAILNGTGGVPATNSKVPSTVTNSSQIPNEFIKVGQGFIVRKKAAGDGDMIFNNAMRSNDNTGHFFRKKPRDRYWLELKTPLNIYTTLLVGYIENATNDFEIDYDATLMAVGSDAFYSVLGTRKLGIQGRASFVNTDVVALGTSHHENGEYTISAPTREGIFTSSQSIYLKDKQTGITTDLTKGDYTFTANKGLSEGRFEIVYLPDATLDVVDSEVSSEEVQIYRDGDHFVAKSKTSKIMKIQLFNMSGQYLISVSPELKEYKWSHQLLNNGVYIVNIQLENGKIISKKILK